uniref:Uncharacterized protein n=1 Tax=Anguilla anguilla TaxID=7936 RepID=A0A0E9SL15_ANGAN
MKWCPYSYSSRLFFYVSKYECCVSTCSAWMWLGFILCYFNSVLFLQDQLNIPHFAFISHSVLQ